jgi:outer membrane protein
MQYLYFSKRPLRLVLAAVFCLGNPVLSGQSLHEAEALLPENLLPGFRTLVAGSHEQSNRLQQEQARLEEARGEVQATDAANRPRVSFNARIVGQHEERIGAENENFQPSRVILGSSLQLTQPLYAWGALEAQKDIGRFREEATQASVGHMRESIFLELRSVVLDWLIALQSREVARESLALAERLEKAQDRLHEQGNASTQEWLEAGIAAREARDNLASAEAYIRELQSRLQLIAGVEAGGLLSVQTAFPEFTPLPDSVLDALVTRARQHQSPSEKAVEANLKVEEANFKRLQANNKPHVDFIAGAFTDAVDDFRPEGVETVPRVIGFAGVQIRWNLFDGFENQGRKIASLARQRRQELIMAETSAQVEQQIRQLLERLRLGAEQIEGRRQRVELIQRRLLLLEAEQQAGRFSITDLLEERLRFERTRQNLLQASKDYLINLTRLYIFAFGDPLTPAQK